MTARKSVLLRLDPAVYEAVARWAADDLRSVNAQIEYALRRALRAAGRSTPSAQGHSTPSAQGHSASGSAETSSSSSDGFESSDD